MVRNLQKSIQVTCQVTQTNTPTTKAVQLKLKRGKRITQNMTAHYSNWLEPKIKSFIQSLGNGKKEFSNSFNSSEGLLRCKIAQIVLPQDASEWIAKPMHPDQEQIRPDESTYRPTPADLVLQEAGSKLLVYSQVYSFLQIKLDIEDYRDPSGFAEKQLLQDFAQQYVGFIRPLFDGGVLEREFHQLLRDMRWGIRDGYMKTDGFGAEKVYDMVQNVDDGTGSTYEQAFFQAAYAQVQATGGLDGLTWSWRYESVKEIEEYFMILSQQGWQRVRKIGIQKTAPVLSEKEVLQSFDASHIRQGCHLGIQRQTPGNQEVCCPNGHKLIASITPSAGYGCNNYQTCGSYPLPKGTQLHGCVHDQCDYDLCEKCYQTAGGANEGDTNEGNKGDATEPTEANTEPTQENTEPTQPQANTTDDDDQNKNSESQMQQSTCTLECKTCGWDENLIGHQCKQCPKARDAEDAEDSDDSDSESDSSDSSDSEDGPDPSAKNLLSKRAKKDGE